MRRPVILLLLVSAVCALLDVGCGRTDSAPKLIIGLGPWVGFGPLYLARDKGFFKEEGIDVDLVVITGLAERSSALRSGRVQALAAPIDYFALSAGNNVEMTTVMAIDESTGGDGIVANDSIQRVEDLVGKRVAFQRGLPAEFFIRAILDRSGISVDQLNTVDMETAQAGAAFISGQVDAAVVWEPWLTRAVDQGKGHILASTRTEPDLIVDALAFTKPTVEQSPDQVQGVVNALLRAIEYWKNNREESNRIMAPYFQVDAAKYAALIEGATFCDLQRNRSYFGTASAPGPIFKVGTQASAVWLKAGVIKAPVKPEAIITTRFVEAAADEK
jgi:NitT/TauT family transport system substrate-binding protein